MNISLISRVRQFAAHGSVAGALFVMAATLAAQTPAAQTPAAVPTPEGQSTRPKYQGVADCRTVPRRADDD